MLKIFSFYYFYVIEKQKKLISDDFLQIYKIKYVIWNSYYPLQYFASSISVNVYSKFLKLLLFGVDSILGQLYNVWV